MVDEEQPPQLPQLITDKLDSIAALYDDDKLLQCSSLLDELREELSSLNAASGSHSNAVHADLLQSALQTPFIQKVQAECDQVHGLKKALDDETGWTLSYDGADTKVFYRRETNTSSHSVLITGTIRAPLIHIAALLYESDLYHRLFWYITSSTNLPVQHASPLKRAVHVVSFAPWPLYHREVAIYAFAVDALDGHNDCILATSRSARPSDGVGDIPSTGARVVRAHLYNSGFELKPVSPGVTKARFICNLDPQLNFVPMPLINWASRMLGRWSLRMIEVRACNLAQVSEEYETRLESNPIYDRMRKRMAEFWAHKGLDFDPKHGGIVAAQRLSGESDRSTGFDVDKKPDVPFSMFASLLAGQGTAPEPGVPASGQSLDSLQTPSPRARLSALIFGSKPAASSS